MASKISNTAKASRSDSAYNLGLTAASLRPELVRIVAERYLAAGDWDIAKEQILASNSLQCRSANSAIRLERELRRRLGTLTHDQLVLAARATADDRAAIAWLAVCKSIRFAFEFASDILRDKLASHDSVLRPSDYEAYVENKGISHPELARLSASSRDKVRRVLRRMLAEAGLVVSGTGLGNIQRPALSPTIVRAIASDNPAWLAGFLVPEAEIPGRQTP